MTALERQAFAKRVVHFYMNFSECNKSATVKHFVKEGAKRRTVYYIIKRYEQRGTANHLPKSGRPLATETTLKTRKLVVKLLVNTNNSERDVAKKCGLTQTCVHNIKIRSGLKTKKCMTVPHHTED